MPYNVGLRKMSLTYYENPEKSMVLYVPSLQKLNLSLKLLCNTCYGTYILANRCHTGATTMTVAMLPLNLTLTL